jgi:hypothetical protein
VTTLTLMIPTIDGREASLERTLASYRAHAGHPYGLVVRLGFPSTGAAWAATLPALQTDLAHLGTDDVTAEVEWSQQVVNEWQWNAGLAVPLVMGMPGGEIESHGVHGRMHLERTQVYWCGVPVVPRCCYNDIAGALLEAALDGDIHYFSDNLISDVLRMNGHQQIALPAYRLGHWWEAGGATPDRWHTDEENYRTWRRRFAGLPLFDDSEHDWAIWRALQPGAIDRMARHG